MMKTINPFISLVIAAAVLALTASTAACAQGHPEWYQMAWAHDPGLYVMPEALAVSDSSVYLAGQAYADFGVTFGSETFDHDPSTDSYSFLAKYTPSGELVWVRPGAFFGGKHQAISAYAVGLDPSGNVLVGEGYQYIYDSGMITNGIVHVVKYSPGGDVIWDVSLGERKEEPEDWPAFAKGLEVNTDGSFYVAGEMAGEFVFGTDTIRTEPFFRDGSPSLDIFLAKYDADGQPDWIEHVHSDKTDYMVGADPKGCLTTDRYDNVYICGQMPAGTVFAEGTEAEFRMPRDAWAVAKYDPTGALQWVKWEGDGGLDVHTQDFYAGGIRRIAIDASDRLLTDWYLNDRDADTWAHVGDVLVEDTLFGAEFLVAHEPDGSALLLAQFKSDGNEYLREMTTDANGNIYVFGGFDGWHLELGHKKLEKRELQADRFDGFVAKLDSDGNVLWTSHYGGAGRDGVQTATISRAGDVYAAAYFETELYIEDQFIRDAIGWQDLILAKYSAATVSNIEDAPAGIEQQIRSRIVIYPNPASARAALEFSLEASSDVRIELYDPMGRRIEVLSSDYYARGLHGLDVDVSSLASGMYLVRARLEQEIETVQLIVVAR